ncbi:MAG TPA: hypothetical protein VFT22_45425 [Kofleriaceae bacterium]|nr:hypothetical protein [Kofleriaceae bacterium]
MRGVVRGVVRRALTGAMQRALAAALAAALGGCTLITDSFLTNDFSGDPFPINVDTTSGAILVGMRRPGLNDRPAVLDLLSPFTVIDDPMGDPSVAYVALTLLGQRQPGGTLDLADTVPRATFPEAQVVALHPCNSECGDGDPACDPGACHVGPPGARVEFQGIIGADVLAGDAVRLRLGDRQLFVLPDVGGDDRKRSLDCDAVFDSPYRGGGTLVIAGTELPFGNRRITLQACLGPDADPDPDPPSSMVPPVPDPATFRQHGADALFVVSTSLGISIINEATYSRYRLAHPELALPELAALDVASVYLPSGLVAGHRTTLERLALVATSSANALSPCRQLYAHRLLTTYQFSSKQCMVSSGSGSTFDCPCGDGNSFCSVPAVLELAPPGGIDVLVVSDDDPTLQALRTELRPDQPEVDGILGTDVLRGAELDVDYPHDRLLARCAGAGCVARPQLVTASDVCPVKRCFTGVHSDQHNGCPTINTLPPVMPVDAGSP